MAFPQWPSQFQQRRSVVPARFWNMVRRQLAIALDGSGGGSYSPVDILEIVGAGLAGYFHAITATEVLTWGALAQDVHRVARISQDSDFTVRDGAVKHDIIQVNGDVLTATRTCTVAVASDSGVTRGEVVYVVLDTPADTLDVASEGGASNPLITLGGGANTDPEWCAIWYDGLAGEWKLLAHGDM